jgi:hypothetical protein
MEYPMNSHTRPAKWLKLKRLITHLDKDMESSELSDIVVGM